MAFCTYGPHEIHYAIRGDEDAPLITFVNGLSMRAEHWNWMVRHLVHSGFRVLVYDLLGQGDSSKPILDVDFDENARVLAALLDHLDVDKAYISGVSFGGLVALKFAILFPERTRGLIPISTFPEIDGQLACHATNLFFGLAKVGFDYYLDLLMPLNFTSPWLEEHQELIRKIKRVAIAGMEVYGIQNLMESLRDFKPMTEDLRSVTCPALVMNGEYDALTPRHLHDVMRTNLPNSRMVIVQNVAHAFIIEVPDLSCQVIANFVQQVEDGSWVGDQAVHIANDRLGGYPVTFPCVGDHLRAIPIGPSLAELEQQTLQLKRA